MKKVIVTIGVSMGSLFASAASDSAVCLASVPIRKEVIIGAVILTLLGGVSGIAGLFKGE